MKQSHSSIELSNSQAYTRISQLAREAGLTNANKATPPENGNKESASNERKENDEDDDTEDKEEREQLIHAQFSACVRELFVQRFVHMLNSYEKFVIVPTLRHSNTNTNKNNSSGCWTNNWWSDREYAGGNFDSKMFLIEQPSPLVPFLSHFIATQMFVSFVDAKIMCIVDERTHGLALLDNTCGGSGDPDGDQDEQLANVRMFDERVRLFKETSAQRGLNLYDLKMDALAGAAWLDKSAIDKAVCERMKRRRASTTSSTSALVANVVDSEAPKARQLPPSSSSIQLTSTDSQHQHCGRRLFESLDADALNADEALIQNIYK